MKDLFYMGGPLFMSILTIVLIAMVSWIIYQVVVFFSSGSIMPEEALRKVSYGKSIGVFAVITGILGQLIGFYQAFTAIEQAGDISPAMVYGGIKVSMITTLYGVIIYLLSLLIWFAATVLIEQRIKR